MAGELIPVRFFDGLAVLWFMADTSSDLWTDSAQVRVHCQTRIHTALGEGKLFCPESVAPEDGGEVWQGWGGRVTFP
jgi:hypothetical protein